MFLLFIVLAARLFNVMRMHTLTKLKGKAVKE